MKVAILGLGIIGSRAAANLAANPDHEIAAWNRTPKNLPRETSDLGEAVRHADLIAMYLKDAPAVREVAARVFDLAENSPTLLNHSTVDLETTRWLAAECARRGWAFLDAPFTGSRDAAGDGKLVYYVGGEESVLESVRDFLHETARLVVPCGPVGHATIIKLVTNLISACSVQAMAEALATGRKHGVPGEALIRAVEANACGSPLAAMKLPAMAEGDFDPHFSLANMLKDSRYALELADGLETPAIASVSRRMEELCENGLGDRDYAALATAYQDS